MKALLITSLFIFIGCGDADNVGLVSKFSPKGGNFNLLSGQDVDPEFRDMTLLIYPNDADLNTHAFNISDYEYELIFNQPALNSKYYKRVPQQIMSSTSSFQKRVEFITTTLSIGAIRDVHYLVELGNGNLADNLRDVLVRDYTSKFPCFKYTSGEHRGDCSLIQTAETEEQEEEPKKSCSSFKRNLKKYPVITDEEKTNFEIAINACEAKDNGQTSNWSKEAREHRGYRENGKNLVIRLFESVEKIINRKLYVGLETGSSIKLDKVLDSEGNFTGKYDLNELSIVLDNGSGKDTYSIANGAINVLSFIQSNDGQKFLKIRMDVKEFVIETDLWFSTSAHFDLRLISNEFVAIYPDGTKRSGVLRIDLEFL